MKINKTFLFVALIAALSQSSLAQKRKIIEPAIMEVHYAHFMVKDTVNNLDTIKDEMILRIGKTTGQFFSKHTFYSDSLWADPNGRKKAEDLSLESLMSPNPSEAFGARTTKDYLYKNYPEGKLLVLANDFIHINFFYEEEYIPQEWTILDSTKQILEHTCKKAECDFRGRHWIAWFAPDVSIKDGPWKLNGLPGLILEAYDRKKDYYYKATSINKNPVMPVTLYKFNDAQEMKTDRIKYNNTLEKYLMGADINELILLQEAQSKGLPIKFSRRRVKKLRYDLLERDHLIK